MAQSPRLDMEEASELSQRAEAVTMLEDGEPTLRASHSSRTKERRAGEMMLEVETTGEHRRTRAEAHHQGEQEAWEEVEVVAELASSASKKATSPMNALMQTPDLVAAAEPVSNVVKMVTCQENARTQIRGQEVAAEPASSVVRKVICPESVLTQTAAEVVVVAATELASSAVKKATSQETAPTQMTPTDPRASAEVVAAVIEAQ